MWEGARILGFKLRVMTKARILCVPCNPPHPTSLKSESRRTQQGCWRRPGGTRRPLSPTRHQLRFDPRSPMRGHHLPHNWVRHMRANSLDSKPSERRRIGSSALRRHFVPLREVAQGNLRDHPVGAPWLCEETRNTRRAQQAGNA